MKSNPTPTIQPRPGRPRDEENAARRRSEILKLAIAEFAKNGFNGADLDAIAKAAGCSKGTLYNYFPSKTELFTASVDLVMINMKHATGLSEDGDPLEQLQKLFYGFLHYFADHPEYVELLVQERSDFPHREQPTYHTYRAASREMWTKRLQQMVADGRMRPMPVDRVINILGDLLYGTIFMNRIRGRKIDPNRQAADILEVFLGGILTEQELQRFLKKNP
jgi:AcrR family transcriptional regulator